MPSVILLILVAAAIAGLALTLLSTFKAERQLRDQVALTSDVLTDLRLVQRGATDAETGQRGYVLTGDDRYLRPYLTGSRDALPALDRVEERLDLVATDEQRADLDQLRRALTSKLRELEIAVELVRAGQREDALRWVDTNTGYELMGEIRRVVAKLEATEQEILNDNLIAVERQEARTGPIIVILSILTLAFLLIGLWGGMRTLQAERSARRAEQDRAARAQSDLLARELNHRVKNLLAVVQAVVSSTLRGEKDMDVASVKVSERIAALATAHAVSQGALDQPIVGLRSLLETTLSPYDMPGRGLELVGDPINIPTDAVTPIGLIVHELATNAMKYGAWKEEAGGNVRVSWQSLEGEDGLPMLEWVWTETGGPAVAAPSENGFGSRMIDMSVRQLRGDIERDWQRDGMQLTVRFALPAAS
ncbi:CHASE3 domain-containing protein [Sphingomicrobium flavum]|uniref:CHASE3 domain-containing protein n=1 Tax=Sphingomicrobium flavum TaxID=1229164 RepID=UPI0021ADF941|nr:CHASE3 domain-containing protein [Sphingomicrobium flavum]